MKPGSERPLLPNITTSVKNDSKEETSREKFTVGPSLDGQRAQSALFHVRALNTQFASWVQLQLQNHADDLWEDGVRDYLSHASHIMEQFKDVVEWIKANTTHCASLSMTASANCQSNLAPAPPFHSITSNGSVNEGSSSAFPSFLSSGTPVFGTGSLGVSTVQTPLFNGNQPFASSKVEDSNDPDEDDLPQPSSPSLKKAEETGIVVVHEAKCKVYIKSDNPADKGWKDMGMGQLSIRCKEGAAKASKDSKPKIVVRNDIGRVLLNALIYPGIKMNVQKNTIATIFYTSDDGKTDVAGEGKDERAAAPQMYLLKTRTVEDTAKLADAIKEHTPSV